MADGGLQPVRRETIRRSRDAARRATRLIPAKINLGRNIGGRIKLPRINLKKNQRIGNARSGTRAGVGRRGGAAAAGKSGDRS